MAIVKRFATEDYVSTSIDERAIILPSQPATVGQFIVVAAVDENGKITATETVTLPQAEEVPI